MLSDVTVPTERSHYYTTVYKKKNSKSMCVYIEQLPHVGQSTIMYVTCVNLRSTKGFL